MIEVTLRISLPRKVTSPSHTFSSGQVHILASCTSQILFFLVVLVS